MKLFRGDKISNLGTKPGWYRSEGLRSKAFGGGGDPTYIRREKLIESIRKHVKPNPSDESDKRYYSMSDYLSFSTSRDRSIFWGTDKNKLNLISCNEYDETRYLFTLDIDDNKLSQVESGIFTYLFNCNLSLKTANNIDPSKVNANDLLNGTDQNTESLLATVFANKAQNESCTICGNGKYQHQIILINSYDYLLKNKNNSKYDGAIKFAKQDDEWLVFPVDTLEGGHGFPSARIPRADFWSAEHYRVEGELREDLDVLYK